MTSCCADTESELEKMRTNQRRVLVVVLLINSLLFLVEITAGLVASSTALLADSLDMLADALVYGFSLYVVSRDDLWKARSATIKGWVMMLFGISVLAHTFYKISFPQVPSFSIIESIALLALIGNTTCLLLLWRHRSDDVNMRSIWLCSRNDIIANVSVLAAGVCVWFFVSQIPDIVVGLGIAALFLRSAVSVLQDAAVARATALQPAAQLQEVTGLQQP